MDEIFLRVNRQQFHAQLHQLADQPHVIRVIVRDQNIVYVLDLLSRFTHGMTKSRERSCPAGIKENGSIRTFDQICIGCTVLDLFDHLTQVSDIKRLQSPDQCF